MNEEKETKFTVKCCTKCNHAWEQNGKKTVVYIDFPTYGLQRKTCSFCIKKEQLMEDYSYGYK